MENIEGKTSEESKNPHKCCRDGHWHGGGNGGGLVWVLGVIGASIYYIQQADSFGAGVLGVLKGLVWPAILVYQLLSF